MKRKKQPKTKRRLEFKQKKDSTTKPTKSIKTTKNTKKTSKKTEAIKNKTAKIEASENKIESKENDYYFCALCGEKYVDPPAEDWIQCNSCNSWWHEECTSYEEGIFICYMCTNE